MSAWKTGSIGFKVMSDAIQTQSVSVPSTALYDMYLNACKCTCAYVFVFIHVFVRFVVHVCVCVFEVKLFPTCQYLPGLGECNTIGCVLYILTLTHTWVQLIFRVAALGVLCCFTFVVCLTLLASIFLPSASLANMYTLPHA